MDNLRFITKYGYKFSFISFVATILAFYFDFFFLFFLSVFFILIFIFRNPERLAESDDINAILSPADGVISFIGIDHYMGNEFLKVSIQNSPFDCGVVRTPLKFDSVNFKERFGLCGFFGLNKKFINSRVLICSKFEQNDIILRLICGGISSYIYYEKNKNFQRCERIGFIYDGIVELFLPVNSVLKVSEGDKIYATNLIGFLGGENARK